MFVLYVLAALVPIGILVYKMLTKLVLRELADTHWSKNPSVVRVLPKAGYYALEDEWKFCCADENPKPTLIGTLIGRQSWVSTGPAKRNAARDSFDSVANPVHPTGEAAIAASEPRGRPIDAGDAAMKGVEFYSGLQCKDGHWAGDYGGPFFLTPGLVIACYITGFDLGAARKRAIVTYLSNHQQTDGGWGLHMESPSTMFGTAMNYVALRLLGVAADDPRAVHGRQFIHQHGGATSIPSWGKFYLATLGVYEWSGTIPTPPELWLLPTWFPFHPARMWCHSRMVYLPMSFIGGGRFTAKPTALTRELRQELYVQPYESIDWAKSRFDVNLRDLYAKHTILMDIAIVALGWFEKFPIRSLRERGLKFALDYMHAEDVQTNWVDIGPVNKVLNMLSCWYGHGDCEDFRRHCDRLDDYLWVAEDGMKMQGYNGSQLWDTAFAMQAVIDGGLAPKFPEMMRRGHQFIDDTQIKQDEDNRETWFRHISKGGWPFSTNDHGWPISDCTAEGLKVALALREMAVDLGIKTPIAPERLQQAADVLLSYQNQDGGWATYENTRGGRWMEWLNPSEVFGDIMIDYSYVECSSASIQALRKFATQFPSYRREEIEGALKRGGKLIRSLQRPDGGFYGSWAVCFTYGCWFGVEGLLATGEVAGESKRLQGVCDFLLQKQNADGGWGETYLSCVTKGYVGCSSTVVNTAWALLALMHAGCNNHQAVQKGIDFLTSKQLLTGDWAQEKVSGIFNQTCGITYTAYRNVFPIWALGVYNKHYRPHQKAAGKH